MQALIRVGVNQRLGIAGWFAACSLFAISSLAQQPVERITTAVDDADRTTIYGTRPVMARTEDDSGNNANSNLFDSIQFAVTNKTAPIISVSYGLCETALGSSGYSSLNAILAARGAYAVTIVGSDTTTPSITASTTLTLTID